MLSEFRSKSLTVLSKKLAQIISSSSVESEFSPTWIVVQNKEVENWLKIELARLNGLAANFRFIFPSELMWTLYRLKFSDLPKTLPSDRIPIFWQVFDLLGSTDIEKLIKAGFPYSKLDDKTRFQLTAQISDVLDLYQVYRPDMLRKWESRLLSTKDKSERWQLVLWNIIKKNWTNNYPEIPTRVDAFYSLINEIESNGIKKHLLPADIHVFGLSHFSSPFSELVGALSLQTNIYFYSKEIIDPDASTNESLSTIITDWGKLKTNSYQLLTHKVNHTLTVLPSNDKSILGNISSTSENVSGIKVHSCHNSKREAEVLKDSLLSFLDNNNAVGPEDCLILVPDMEKYAPIIESVFSQNNGEIQVPISLPYLNTQSFSKDLISLLDLMTSRFKSSAFLDFVDSELIRNNYEFSLDDIELTRSWFVDNYTHWGLTQADSKFSLETSIKNLMSGFAMEIEPFEMFDSIIPYGKISGARDANLIANLSHIVNKLIDFRGETISEKSVVKWIETLENWLNSFSNKSIESLNFSILVTLKKLKEKCIYSNINSTLPFSLFKVWINTQLSDISASSGAFGHGVTLSSYVPYRSIPFKFIAILGFNESVFPRNPIRPSFDLINLNPLSGERVMLEDDRLLFLETLQSAEKELFISYEGLDQHTENTRLPSILLQKLITVLDESDKTFDKSNHKLHGFDTSYFTKPKSYSEAKKNVAVNTLTSNEKELAFVDDILPKIKSEIDERIHIKDLISFFTNPCKQYALNELNISGGYEKSDVEDRELFNIAALSKYQLEQAIFDGITRNQNVNKIKEYYSTAGLIPVGMTGNLEFEDSWQILNELYEKVKPYILEDEQAIDVDLKIGDINLVGSISGIFGNKRVQVRTGKIRPKDLIPCWINHLILSIIDREFEESLYAGKDKKSNNIIITTSHFFKIDNAKVELKKLIDWYLQSKTKSSLCFFPESSMTYVEELNGKKDALIEAEKKWEGDSYSFNTESKDYFNSLIWRGENPISQKEFSKNALEFFTPLLKNLVSK